MMKSGYRPGLSPLVAVLVMCLCPRANAQSQHWPAIRPTRIGVPFPDARKADTTVVIKESNGKPLYRLACHTSDYSGDTDFDYSGDFECRLTSLDSSEGYSTLLTDDPQPTRDWQSRGRFLAEDLVGSCGTYPEYGLVRHFRLRGMAITLALRDPVFDTVTAMTGVKRVGLRSFRFEFTAVPDTGAKSPIAERPSVAEPSYRSQDQKIFSKDCDSVRMAPR